MHFWMIAGSTSAAKTFSPEALNAYVAEIFIEDSRSRQRHQASEEFLLCALMLTLIRGLRRAPAPASPGRTQDAPGTPPKRECQRADRPRPPSFGPPPQWAPP